VIGETPRLLTFQAGDSVLHRLDPRTKLLATFAVVAAALMASLPLGMIVAYAMGACIGLGAVHLLPQLWRVLRPLLVLIALFGVLITIVTPGHAIIHIAFIVPTTDGLLLAIRLGLQSLLIIYTTSLLSISTPPLAIADSLQWAFGWLERVRVPVRDVIAMVAIGLTFVPLLIEEAQKVIAAQRARGADLTMNALLEEDSMGALMIPLLLANLRRGEELAESMEARLYNTGRRTALHQYHFRRIDAYAAAIVLAFLVAVAVVSFVL